MGHITPEKAGISSAKIQEFIDVLEQKQLSTHDVILMKGNDIIFEKYWAPFNKDFLHRMYSVTKSFVAVAIGFLEQDGMIDLNDKIVKYFPDENKKHNEVNMQKQTIRDMLMMSTSRLDCGWFSAKPEDRVRFYFEEGEKSSRVPGTTFHYDSTGSFVLGALVEKLTGMPLIDYLRVKLFDKIGISKEAYMLKCPGGWSWGDSALICTARDLLKFSRFVMNYGKWNGEQLLNEKFLRDATSKLVDNNTKGVETYDSQGYGYLIWRTYDNSFSFNGMGCQFGICVPDKDLILVYNGDNQGKEHAKNIIFENFFRLIARTASDKPLPENSAAADALEKRTADLKLAAAIGESESAFADKINGVTYKLMDNPMEISKICVELNGKKGKLKYTNAQGDKVLEFGMCENAFGVFPQEGYADMVGTKTTTGMFYKCAVSATWTEPQKLFFKVQVIDKYFGTLNITLSFKNDEVTVFMNKCAEDFMNEYEGYAWGIEE